MHFHLAFEAKKSLPPCASVHHRRDERHSLPDSSWCYLSVLGQCQYVPNKKGSMVRRDPRDQNECFLNEQMTNTRPTTQAYASPFPQLSLQFEELPDIVGKHVISAGFFLLRAPGTACDALP